MFQGSVAAFHLEWFVENFAGLMLVFYFTILAVFMPVGFYLYGQQLYQYYPLFGLISDSSCLSS